MHFVILNHFRHDKRVSLPYYLFRSLNNHSKNPSNSVLHCRLLLLIYEHCKTLTILENKRLSASSGKRKLEGGDSSKEKVYSSKKSKSASGIETHEEKIETKEMGKEGSEMDMDDSDGEDSWKDEEVGIKEEGDDSESNNESPIHSDCPGKDNSHPMEDVEYKDNEDKDVNSEREENKDPKKDMTKDSLSKDKESVGKGLFLDNLRKLSEARLDYDRWTYELLKNLEKNGKRVDEKRKDNDRD